MILQILVYTINDKMTKYLQQKNHVWVAKAIIKNK